MSIESEKSIADIFRIISLYDEFERSPIYIELMNIITNCFSSPNAYYTRADSAQFNIPFLLKESIEFKNIVTKLNNNIFDKNNLVDIAELKQIIRLGLSKSDCMLYMSSDDEIVEYTYLDIIKLPLFDNNNSKDEK
jgi:hypothetical protein